MKLYSCKVRLSGSLYNEVPKYGVTTPEVQLFKLIHGDDSVVEIVETGTDKRSQAEERDRLTSEYGPALVTMKVGQTPEQALGNVFGIAGRLPDGIAGAPKAPKADKKAEPEVEDEAPEEGEDPEE